MFYKIDNINILNLFWIYFESILNATKSCWKLSDGDVAIIKISVWSNKRDLPSSSVIFSFPIVILHSLFIIVVVNHWRVNTINSVQEWRKFIIYKIHIDYEWFNLTIYGLISFFISNLSILHDIIPSWYIYINYKNFNFANLLRILLRIFRFLLDIYIF